MSDVTAGSIFNPQFFMNPPWWMGRVEEKETWSDNIEGETFTSVANIKGWGHRYKVRIFNWHTGELDTLPPKEMAFCQVVMPVNAGSGHGGGATTPSIESGSVVFGFFMDGMPGQEGYIMGVLGNSNNNVPKKRGEAAPNQTTNTPSGSSASSTPTTGPGSLSNVPLSAVPNVDQLSTNQLIKLLDPSKTPSSEVFKAASEERQKAKAQGLPAAEVERLALVATVKASRQPGALAGATGNCNLGYQQFNDTYTDGDEMRSAKVPDDRIVANTPLSVTEAQHIRNLATEIQDIDMRKRVPLLNVCKKDDTEIAGIQLEMQNLLNDIGILKKQFNQVSAFSTEVQAYTNQVEAKVVTASQIIAGFLKNLLTDSRGAVLVEFNKQIDKITPFLFPTLIPDTYMLVEEGLNLINCLFNALIDGLITLLINLLSNILDDFINAPLCAAENLTSNFVNSILGPITSTLQASLAPINALVGGGGLTSVLGSFGDDILDLITGILQFFFCDSSPDCIQYNRISQAGPAIPYFNFNLPTLEDGSGGSGCQTGPVIGGPPFVGVFGQTEPGSTQPSINPVISPISSSVIAFDIIDPGSGFLGTPTAVLDDPLGKGNGANLQVNLEDGSTGGSSGTDTDECDIPRALFEKVITDKLSTPKRIKNITILAPGNGYLAAPDGSLGGGGRVWKEPDEGYVRTKCGGYYVVQPYRPISVRAGDTYYPPDGPSVLIEEDQVITLPLLPINQPNPEALGVTYSVILTIEEIKVIDNGFGYRSGDQLIITPDNGTQTELVINESGSIDSVKVIRGGSGFLDFPQINTNSLTGFNASFTPIFKVSRLDDFNRDNEEISRNLPFISVVDCVGKISPKSVFDIIPR